MRESKPERFKRKVVLAMREILFRGKRMDCGCWEFGYYSEYHRSNGEIHCFINGFEYQVDPATIGQYTGLTDKNGKKIFEGDIIEVVLPERESIRRFVWPLMKVIFQDGAFRIIDESGDTLTTISGFAPSVTFEVKGNVHDNPELLKGGDPDGI